MRLKELRKKAGISQSELGNKLVPSCVYRNFCPENNENCGYSKEFLRKWREEYIGGREQLL